MDTNDKKFRIAFLNFFSYNAYMPIKQFFIVAVICACQTIFFVQAMQAGSTLISFFWGFLLVRNLYRVYVVDRIGRVLEDLTKKKD